MHTGVLVSLGRGLAVAQVKERVGEVRELCRSVSVTNRERGVS